ncbi:MULTISPECIES: hypothetical protein [Enterobacteriaceae]|jgi:uncharacterized BrkB/YihY/UPF0761 family membrane protein|uniref:Uncharacterized protein n=2 Tax=Enterobacter cloacae TaxID=550 RepID=A0A0H3CHJ9_ENTCC|nr:MULTISPECIES: hypothetical protein [Enterobacteriaceae]AUU88921.1 hypothetical protein C2U55_07415 [Enterobacteriaceae bacterium ENNIH3]AUV05788.1 hypothetical protein C2U52_05550 [Enterobacteriaceae bacterium ENNIH2]ELD7981836.1 hypothetical protein [Enterobacter hormaechei]MDU4295319.1 hypothetical protein [Enterobacter asburiae]HBM3127749.1 hypothetical protein [Klebsiella michiganensis]HCD7315853.1 hypothetical protein [Enterobacter chengduensis]HED1379811.1 hypothetical protein [Ente
MKRSFLRGRTGRIVLMIAALLLITVAMFALASVFMAYDPDGHLTRRWLHDSRWALFTWRLLMYAGIAVVWRMKVRPQMLARWPEVRARLPRTELLGVLFIAATECVAWAGVA